MNRRTFIGVLSGAVVGSALAKPVRSSLGADNGSKGDGEWSNPYVLDGLIAMWDAEWNAGGGMHDSQSRIVNLCGGSDIFLSPSCVIGDKSISYTTETAFSSADDTGCFGGITGEMDELPAAGERATFETVSSPAYAGTGWGDFAIAVTFRDGVFYSKRHLRYGVIGCATDSGGIFGPFNLTPSVYTTASMSGRSTAWNASEGYYNGVLQSKASSFDASVRATDNRVRILGSNVVGATCDFSCLRIYNRALSTDEIAYNYSVDKERFGV